MNNNTLNLLEKVNNKLTSTPLFYFSKDPERGIGLENYLENFRIVALEKNHIANSLGNIVFCPKNVSSNSSADLLDIPEVLELLNLNKFYSQFFYVTSSVLNKAKKLGGIVLNNDYLLSQKFENKLSQYNFLKTLDINIPKGFIEESNKVEYSEITKILGEKFVIQLAKGHTGNSTFVISNSFEFDNFQKQYIGTNAKFTEFIEGETFTINACITKKTYFISSPQFQITGEEVLTNSRGTTVGNDWSYAKNLNNFTINKIKEMIRKIAEGMKKEGFRGLFGLDFIVKQDLAYVIEINARQTANISMQTKLDLKNDITPISLINLAEFLDIDIDLSPENEINLLEGSQIFLRSKSDNFKIDSEIKSGIYRLQSDNTARSEKKENVIFIDEEQDMPLVFQNEGYNILDIRNGGFVLTVAPKNSIKNKTDEIARMQFIEGIVYNGRVKPWALSAMKTIEQHIK